jgi:HlyD family secretion protein
MRQPPKWSARLPAVVGFSAVFVLVGVIGAWSVGTEIAGAVVAQGVVKAENDRQVVQHPDGGVVGEILARDGDVVEAGQTLVRFDDTFLRSELVVVERQLAETFARRARLEAEQSDAPAPEFSNAPEFVTLEPHVLRAQVDGQRALFDARLTSLSQERAQIREQQRQIERQVEGISAELTAMRRQLELTSQELEGIEGLFERGFAQRSRLIELQREEAGLQGEVGRLLASLAEAETRISTLEIEVLKLADRRREEAITTLRDLQYSEIELEERRLALVERMSRLDVRAPVAGIVFGSRVFALQSVVQPAEPMMYLVAADQPLHVSARIEPNDVDQIYPGQDVSMLFTTFSTRTTPEIPGRVVRVSADTEVDEVSGMAFYEAVIVPEPLALADLPELRLLPGMPVEAFLKTTERTPLSYLSQPLTVYFNRAFREE